MPLTDDVLEILKDQLQKTNDNIAVLEKKKFEIQEGIQKYILQAKLYETDFVPYKGQWLDEITLIIEDNSGIHYIHYDGASVDNNAHISAYHTGEFSHCGYSWSDKDQSYVYDTCFDNTKFPVKIIGFYDVKMDE